MSSFEMSEIGDEAGGTSEITNHVTKPKKTFQDIVQGIEFRYLSDDELPIMMRYIEANNGIGGIYGDWWFDIFTSIENIEFVYWLFTKENKIFKKVYGVIYFTPEETYKGIPVFYEHYVLKLSGYRT